MTRRDSSRSDRALELYEQKVAIWVIAERLGTSSFSSVCAMINKARSRRDKAGEVDA